MNKTDRYYIERKYHDPEQPFDAFKRRDYHGIGYMEDTGLSDEQILAGLQQLDLTGPHPVSRAKAIAYVLENERLYINEHDYFVGLDSLGRLANTVTFKPWEAESQKLRKPELVRSAKNLNNSGAAAIWTDYDHVVPDWESLMKLGFPGIRQRARDYRQMHRENGTLDEKAEAFFEGIEIQYTAIIALLDRMYSTAQKQTFEKAPMIAACLKSLRDGRPNNIYEAMQLIYLYFIISECIDGYQVRSLGNGLDRTLYPFYKKDLEQGTFTPEQIRELLGYFLLQWSAIGNYWGQPFYMGGTDLQGNTKYNELSYEILDVYDKLEIYNPKIQMKLDTNIPERICHKALDMIRRKNASIVFCCDRAMVRAVMSYGATYAEALDMDIRGCYETGVRANEVCPTSGYVNAAKAVEYVFTDGFDREIQQQVGIRTGPVSRMNTFEDFYTAFLEQWTYLIDLCARITNDAEHFLDYVNPSSMYSATIETSLQNGRDGYAGGVKFNNNGMLCCSFGSAVDSVVAVKEFVFDKKLISLEELAAALENNWQGYEKLRLKIMRSPHKYGNNDPLADTYAAAMADYYAAAVNGRPNGRGGVYKAIMHSARQFVRQGSKTGALPNGRLAGQELSKNGDPEMGMDKKGVTALIASVLKTSPAQFPESFCLDVMLHPSAVAGDDGLQAMKALLMTYLQGGGMSIQFNIFSPETLRDAQQHPEKYQNLQVRVCGWNVLWNNMSLQEQNAYILRSENIQ